MNTGKGRDFLHPERVGAMLYGLARDDLWLFISIRNGRPLSMIASTRYPTFVALSADWQQLGR